MCDLGMWNFLVYLFVAQANTCLWELNLSYPPQHEKAVQMEQSAHYY